jgi:hypothetical protein
MNSSKSRNALATATAVAATFLAGCGGVSEMAKERVARSETVLRQAQQTVGKSESGALELETARNHLVQARRALDAKQEEPALRHARQAELSAELAIARSQSAAAREAAEEVQASIRTLREETERDQTERDRGSRTATDEW